MVVLIFFILFYILLSISLFFLFPKAGVDGWKGLVPGLNFMEWAEIVGRPRWYGLLAFIPIVNFFIVAGMAVAMAKSFGRNEFIDAVLAVIYAPVLFFKYAFGNQYKYKGKAMEAEVAYMNQIKAAQKEKNNRKLKKLLNNHPYPKAFWREWVESIFFAVFAAAFIRMFLIEAYVIPTPSMEGSLNVGDYLFVSKASYGIRTPQTVAMVPLLHNRLPIVGSESYFKKPSLPYFRLKAMNDIEREGKIVFNWPIGDSVYITSSRSYSVEMINRNPIYLSHDRELAKEVSNKNFVVRPVDKKDHYIKRCVGIPGDSLQIKDAEIWINGEKSPRPKYVQYQYIISTSGVAINQNKFEQWGIEASDYWGQRGGLQGYFLDDSQVEKVRAMDPNIKLTRVTHRSEKGKMFPHSAQSDSWSVDNFGPIYIPQKGVTVTLNAESLPFYQRIINVYENNDLKIENGKISINGEQTSTYTFKQDYYWGMGDNRHNSEDSRMWGFIPHDHIVGEPLFIWFSAKDGNPFKGIHWDRIFTSARNK
ncbi:MAG: signal peptidase I [Saprospiraceae bacterium]